MINEYNAYSLADFMNIVSGIGQKAGKVAGTPPLLWFRGHRDYTWDLAPSIFRKVSDREHSLNREENARKEHFIAKNSQFFEQKPGVPVEWLEVMQHHDVKTRLLDWSESAMHSLIFTLECFFKNDEHFEADRMSACPCMWVFEPQKWNEYVIQSVINEVEAGSYVEELAINKTEKAKLQQAIKKLKTNSRIWDISSAPHLSRIFNFAEIEKNALEFSARGRKIGR